MGWPAGRQAEHDHSSKRCRRHLLMNELINLKPKGFVWLLLLFYLYQVCFLFEAVLSWSVLLLVNDQTPDSVTVGHHSVGYSKITEFWLILPHLIRLQQSRGIQSHIDPRLERVPGVLTITTTKHTRKQQQDQHVSAH